MVRKLAVALVAATVLLVPICVAQSVAATPPATVEPGKATSKSKLKSSKIKASKIKTVKAKTVKAKTFKDKTAKANSGKKLVMTKSKRQAKAQRQTPAEYTGSIAPRSVPTPGLY